MDLPSMKSGRADMPERPKHIQDILRERAVEETLKGRGWSINALHIATGFDRRTITGALSEAGKQPDKDGRYSLRDFVDAMIARAAAADTKKEGSDVLEVELARKAARQVALLDIDLAERRNEVILTELVFQTWENVIVSIRRTILTSPLPDAQKDAILKELQTIPIESFLEQRAFADGAPAEDAEPVRTASPAKNK